MSPLLLVMAGGALGAGARFLFGRAVTDLAPGAWPWGTFAINVLGGLLMGILSAAILRGHAGEPHRLLLGVGVLGGFTTFSTFSLETARLIADGQVGLAAGYMAASVFGALAALYAGHALVDAL